MFIDTHAHLWWDSYSQDLDSVIERARVNGVEKMIAPGTDLLTSKRAVDLAHRYPSIIYAAVGIHPEETVNKTLAVTKNALMFNSQMKKMRELIAANRDSIVAVGEIGTDANTEELRLSMKEQKDLFREQCEIALEFDLPIIVHTRKSFAETMEVLTSLSKMPNGQFHCFSYDHPEADIVLKNGFSLSFCGNISWSKRLQRLSPTIPLDRLLLETDSPFMIPRDEKGEPLDTSLRNEPKNVTLLAQILADLRGVSQEELGDHTSANAERIYHI
jgi:TatD DNase family protein